MNITIVGIDLAKNVLQLHGVDERRQVSLKKPMKRAQVLPFFATLPPCLIGMEACGSAHYWARQLEQLGHTFSLRASHFVKPYVKTHQHDAADAEAICEAVGRPTMRFVPRKTGDQQAILALHRAWQGFVKARTAQANQIRGFLAEYGIVIPQGIGHIAERLPAILEDGENELPGIVRELLQRLSEHLQVLDRQARDLEQQIQRWHQAQAASRRLAKIPGIGPLTASALVASIGDARSFRNGRQVAAWIGLTPRQHSSGDQPTVVGIGQRGDSYLRTLLIHGARAVIAATERQRHPADSWLTRLLSRRHKNVAAVALANKNARRVWALLAHDREFRSAPDATAAAGA